MIPYNEQFHLTRTGPTLAADYTEAHRHVGDDPNWVVWPSRIERDVCESNLTYEASLAKHRHEWRTALGLPSLFNPAPRYWRANMCGIRIVGLPRVPGGATDAALFLSWFYHLYDVGWRSAIRGQMQTKDYTHWLLSWPDARQAGVSPPQFLSQCQELIADGFYPCVMLASKDCDPHDVHQILNGLDAILPLLVGVVPMFCIGWELSLWLTPTEVQLLIDAITAQTLTQAGTLNYVHFQEGYFAFQQPGGTTADFWKANVGKLTGVLHQRDLSWDKPMYQARITDCLQRFAGQFNFPTDSGFGHPFDFVALEITAQPQFNGAMSEADGNMWGQTAITTPPVSSVKVMGSGNGM